MTTYLFNISFQHHHTSHVHNILLEAMSYSTALIDRGSDEILLSTCVQIVPCRTPSQCSSSYIAAIPCRNDSPDWLKSDNWLADKIFLRACVQIVPPSAMWSGRSLKPSSPSHNFFTFIVALLYPPVPLPPQARPTPTANIRRRLFRPRSRERLRLTGQISPGTQIDIHLRNIAKSSL